MLFDSRRPRMPIAGSIELVAFLTLTAVSIALALIDLDTKRLPNVIVVPSLLAGVVLLGAAALVRGDLTALAGAAIGGAGLFLLYFVLALVSRGGMGMGDVKLAAVLGLYLGFLGWGNLLVGAFAAFIFGGGFGSCCSSCGGPAARAPSPSAPG